MEMDQPWAMSPTSCGPSSLTYNDQVPWALVALKTAKEVPNGPDGAGAGNVSELASTFVGRNVPLVMAFESGSAGPESSSVRVTPSSTLLPPTSESSRTFC